MVTVNYNKIYIYYNQSISLLLHNKTDKMFKSLITKNSKSARAYLATKVNPPKLFDYETITKNLKPSLQSINAIETAFGMVL